MSQFEPALALVLKQEGGFVDEASDPGGATNFGISLRFLKTENVIDGDFDGNGQIDVQDIKAMTRDEASELYRALFWEANQLEKIRSQSIANALFSSIVNIGQSKAVRLMQLSVNQCVRRTLLKPDGVLGPLSLSAINTRRDFILLGSFRNLLSSYYIHLAKSEPDLSRYLRGWLNRCNSL